jgi:hypothetical protein
VHDSGPSVAATRGIYTPLVRAKLFLAVEDMDQFPALKEKDKRRTILSQQEI